MFLGGLIEIASVVSNALDSSNKTVSNKRCKSSTTVRGRFEGVQAQAYKFKTIFHFLTRVLKCHDFYFVK